MKRFINIVQIIILFLFVSVLFSCENGESYEDLVLRATGNIWYKYENTSDTADKPVYNSEELANLYIKYDTVNEKLIFAAIGTRHYAQTEKSLSSGKWVTMITVETLATGRLKKASDPTLNKSRIENFDDWGTYTLEYLVNILFN